MPISLPPMNRSLLVFVSTASVTTCYGLWKLIQWRARKLAREAVENVGIREGPLIDSANYRQRQRIVATAISRASHWSNLVQRAQPMEQQVGGISSHKRPMLTLPPDYVLKPLLMDHRGIREMHFYESVFHSASNKSDRQQQASASQPRSFSGRVVDPVDTLAMACAIVLQDPIVLELEEQIHRARQRRKRQADLLRRLAPLIPEYYGVVGQNTHTTAHLTAKAHLLLHNIVNSDSFTTPCVMDIKMGQETYVRNQWQQRCVPLTVSMQEPDAPPSKIARESSKYTPMQAEFGFRIVGMRVVEYPSSAGESSLENEAPTIRAYPKSFGRSLTTHDALLDAFRTFLRPASHRCISNFLIQLRPLIRWMEENDTLQFCASSLLLVYEGEDSDAGGGHSSSDVVALKMIDFGRVRHRVGGDPGYRHGLRTLRRILMQLQEEQAKSSSAGGGGSPGR